MSQKLKKVVVFLGNSSDFDQIQQFSSNNGLEIVYTFNNKSGQLNAAESPLFTFVKLKQGLDETVAILNREKKFKDSAFSRKINYEIKRFRKNLCMDDNSFMAMVDYVSHYKQCQGLLVYDIKDLCPGNLSVVSWLIDKIHASNKEFYSVIPYDINSLPRYKKNIESVFNKKWNKLIDASDFHVRKCPPVVSICVFENHCFLKCRFCYQVKNPKAVKEDYMDFDLFKKIINDIPIDEHLKIVLGPGGEPLTYPKIHEMVRYVTDNRPLAITEYSTNGILMNRENALKIIESGLKRIEVSLNVPTREDYEWFTGVDAYDTVVSNMINLIRLRQENDSLTPTVVTKIMGIKRWADKIENFLDYFNTIVDEARVSAVSYYQDTEIENIDSLKLKTNPLVPTCFYLTSNIIVNPNGRYQLCCSPDFAGEKYGPVDLGNARDKNLIYVWNGDIYKELRRINAQGLPIFSNCMTCNINNPDFNSDLIIKGKQRKMNAFRNP